MTTAIPDQPKGKCTLISTLEESAGSLKLHDEIYARLQHALIVGEFVPGQTFTMRALAEQFGTSLIPVRDALKRLVAENALQLTVGRTVYISMMDRNRFLDILRARLILEPDLALRATDLMTDQEIAAMAESNERMQASVDDDNPRRYLANNYNFHFMLYRAAQSPVILPIVRSIWMQVGPFLNFLFRTHGVARAKGHHANVLRALRRRDPSSVADAIRSDISDAADIIISRGQFSPEGLVRPPATALRKERTFIESKRTTGKSVNGFPQGSVRRLDREERK